MRREMVAAQGHDEKAWRKYKAGRISYGEYLEAGKYEHPENPTLAELMAVVGDRGTPRAADV